MEKKTTDTLFKIEEELFQILQCSWGIDLCKMLELLVLVSIFDEVTTMGIWTALPWMMQFRFFLVVGLAIPWDLWD